MQAIISCMYISRDVLRTIEEEFSDMFGVLHASQVVLRLITATLVQGRQVWCAPVVVCLCLGVWRCGGGGGVLWERVCI
jgi:hypothetical protein